MSFNWLNKCCNWFDVTTVKGGIILQFNSKHRQASKQSKTVLRHQGGFIITIELLLIVTILVIGLLVGIVAIRDALVKRHVAQQAQKTYIVDSKGAVLGEATGYDEHDAPRVFYVDRSQDENYRVLIGIRDDRFTSREPIYYATNNCTGDPCIKSTSNESSDSRGVSQLAHTGSVSYFNALQNGPNYAIGKGANGLKGFLYRETLNECPAEARDIASRWISQKVVKGEPCEPFSFEESGGQSDAYTACLVSNLSSCQCPASYNDQGDILDNYLPLIEQQVSQLVTSINLLLVVTGQQIDTVEIGTLCCEEGTQLSDAGLIDAVTYIVVDSLLEQIVFPTVGNLKEQIQAIIEPLQRPIVCDAFVELKLAESVPAPGDSSQNALEVFKAPFAVNLPSDAGSDTWYSTPPDGEGIQRP